MFDRRHNLQGLRAKFRRGEDDAHNGQIPISFIWPATITLAESDGGTDLLAVHDALPPVLPSADNETGWRASLAKLAVLFEAELGHARAGS